MKTNKMIKSIKDNNFLLGFLVGIITGLLIAPLKNGMIIGSYNGNCYNKIADKKHKKGVKVK